jgi:hypothetical protein
VASSTEPRPAERLERRDQKPMAAKKKAKKKAKKR